ncbi:amino acid ABC transporter substrate-binding protein [Phototrophicus methaneseepsis]|uniref:Amino acid ABC transporter substrate-binding protein n=1 Tax=Phototrophicus methaneseepsis TaxID=2710758 RepID=A0A7S8E945_9CHLR|nr:amino acid ABC transporter substrate-binding protein [Phototrophicus methaneseepsis]QPC82519.1 amino acid ABC transporter substrate-binding protein [Phototrophicus methaneseepsis]
MSKKGLLLVVTAMFIALVGGVVTAQEAVDVELGEITQRIIDRGELICGANQSLTGFGFVNDEGEFEGFDVDLCRAVAAAVLGDANAVSFRPLTSSERQAAIQSGEIDMMSRNTTWTLSRDVVWGAIFGPTMFYDGQGIGTTADMGVSSGLELDGASICVQTGTTTELNIADFVEANGLDIEIQVYPDANSTWEAFLSGACEAWTTDKSGIASFHATSEDPGSLVILPDTLSKEPLGPLSPAGDEQFAEIVAWTMFGLITAEEEGITSENIDEFLESDDPEIGRLLGVGDNISGDYLGLDNDFMVEVIRQVGNYGEIYERNLAPLGLSREGTVNALWEDGGLLYAPPFR